MPGKISRGEAAPDEIRVDAATPGETRGDATQPGETRGDATQPGETRGDAAQPGEIYVGKADLDAPEERGWLLGHFKPPGDPRHSTDVEIKWGRHTKGDRRAQWVRGEDRTALLILISGRFHMEFPDRTVVLTTPGDYVVWPRGVDHSWLAEQESVVLTVRWPSIPGYAVPAT